MALTDLQHFMKQAGAAVINAGLYLMLTRAHGEFAALYQAARTSGGTVAAREARDDDSSIRAEFARHGLNYDCTRIAPGTALAGDATSS